MRDTTVFDCTLIEMDKHHSDNKGNITVVENSKTIPFDVSVQRVSAAPLSAGSTWTRRGCLSPSASFSAACRARWRGSTAMWWTAS